MTTSTRHRLVAAFAAIFGMVTMIAGTRVLLGRNPGYTPVKAVVLFNATMGFAYLLDAILIFRASRRARFVARLIAELNAAVLFSVLAMRILSFDVAAETIAAMTIRTAFWFAVVYTLRLPGSSGAAADEG